MYIRTYIKTTYVHKHIYVRIRTCAVRHGIVLSAIDSSAMDSSAIGVQCSEQLAIVHKLACTSVQMGEYVSTQTLVTQVIHCVAQYM